MITFDGPSRIATLSAGTVELSVRDLWSRWADWVAQGTNSRFLPAMRTIGGDDIDVAAGTRVPIYCYLVNGWRIRPQSADHTLVVNDGVLLVDGGGDPFVNPTGGPYAVRLAYSQPVQAITVATGGAAAGPSAAQIAEAVWQRAIEAGMPADAVLRVALAALTGQSNGVGTSVENYLSVDGAKPRVTAVFDPSGNRQAVTLDGA